MFHRVPVCVMVCSIVMLGCTTHVDVVTGGHGGATSAGGTGGAATTGGAGSGGDSQGGSGGADSQGGSGGTAGEGGTTSTGTSAFGCSPAMDGMFWLDVQVGGDSLHFTGTCGLPGDSGPFAGATSDGKPAPKWQFGIEACLSNEMFGTGPGMAVSMDIPPDAAITVPYTGPAAVLYHAPDGAVGTSFEPVNTVTFTELGPPHGVVKGTLTGAIDFPSATKVPVTGQFVLCREPNSVAL